jgi:hypothetical protein
MNDEEMILDGPEGQEGGSADVMGWNERYWMRFLKGMVTDRNTDAEVDQEESLQYDATSVTTWGTSLLNDLREKKDVFTMIGGVQKNKLGAPIL